MAGEDGAGAGRAAMAGLGLSAMALAKVGDSDAVGVPVVAGTVCAMMVDPTTLFARAVGVLNSPEVDAIGVDSAVTVFAALGAGAPASLFSGSEGSPRDESIRSADLNESRIFSAAATSCARMCGICSYTVSAGNRSFMMFGN